MNILVGDAKEISYGGAQEWFSSKRLQGYGCGVIACANILISKCIDRPVGKPMDREDYLKLANRLQNFYLPVIPRHGINGIFLALGMNLYFLIHRIPYRAFWGISSKKRDLRIEEMLKRGIPVCFSVGPNFPNLYGKHRLTFYRKQGENYVPDLEMKSHYVSVTAMDGEWYEISTWGRRMYINRREYAEYVRKYSCSLLSNVLVVR